MINHIRLQHFKCFEILRLPVAPLTLLSGGNASGKSSVLQALVLLHQTMREHEWSTRLMLNGNTINLGTVTDVIDKVSGRFTFEIGISDDDLTYEWAFFGERADMSMVIEDLMIGDVTYMKIDPLRYLLPHNAEIPSPSLALRLRALTYITAERKGPREVYPLEDIQSVKVVGPTGEHAASVLHQGRDNKVLDKLVLSHVPPTLLRQVEERMVQFFPGCGLVVQQVPQTNAVTLGLRTSSDTDYHRPIHVGFGLTQVFPIIVAALTAGEGDIILIENPEVHLHPAGQALMGQFLAEVVRAGIQVIVETHSDHVLNGIRRSVRAGTLQPEDVALHFFRPRLINTAQVISPKLDNHGSLDSWPEGFFDQFDKDATHFAGWSD